MTPVLTKAKAAIPEAPGSDFIGGEGRALALEIFDEARRMSPDVEGVSRPAFSPTETAMLDYLDGIARRHGLVTWRDAGANLMIARPGDSRVEARHGLLGSHVDTVPQGGNYDGLAGVVTALLALIALEREGAATALPIRVIALRGEESALYGHPYMGSKALFGLLDGRALAARSSLDGRPLRDAMAECGIDMARVEKGEPLVERDHIAFFLELHIEQGPLLIDRNWPVAAVTGIRGNIRHRQVRCFGEAGHSGAVPRWLRKDAVMATADLLIRMDEHWNVIQQHGGDLVLTCGIFHTNPAHNAMTRIPSETSFSFEARSQQATTLRAVEGLLHSECEIIERERGVRFVFDEPVYSKEAFLDASIVEALKTACAEEGLPAETAPSGAGHDAAIYSQAGIRSGMLFVRNANGSHNPHEAMDIDDMLQGVRVFRRAAIALAAAAD